uniref:uncharacterized protein scimp n=1 Tax=Monopterus albus TaxID=43700 RepID=UPI0009B3B775|nr:uncharacterized protein LOC109959350 [Monopterus albus]
MLRRAPMDFLRKFNLLVIIGMIFASVVLGLIFFFINKCISRRGKHRISQLQKKSSLSVRSVKSENKYQERNLDIPALPSRKQFLTAAAQSYENLAEVPDCEQDNVSSEEDIHDYEQPSPEYEQNMDEQPDYLKLENEEEIVPLPSPEYEQNMDEQPDYLKLENEEEIIPPPSPEYEQNMDEQPDYLKLENEEEIIPPPPPYEDPDSAADNASTEDYDDIGGEDENQDEEDYDDLG